MTALSAKGLGFSYPGADTAALRGVDLELAPGTLTALLGPNGSGKSTLLALLAGLLRPTEGAARLAEHDPARLERSRTARLAAFLPARPRLPEDYTAREIVLMGRYPSGRGLLMERPEDVAIADKALARVDAIPFADRPCDALSSGERQRVLLARILCQDTRVLLLDEPTSAQDLAHRLDVFALLHDLAKDGRTIVVATHAINAAARYADRLVVLQDGGIVADGPPDAVLTKQLLAEVFAVDAILGADDDVRYAVPRRRM